MADESNQIVAGSIVVLKSGSVAMEVERINEDMAYCTWENLAGELVQEKFPVPSLDLFTGDNAIAESPPKPS